VLRTLQGQCQNTVFQFGVDLVGVNLKRQPKGPNEAALSSLLAVVGTGVIRLVLALPSKRHRIAMNCDLQVVLLDAGQLGRDYDPVLMRIDVDRRETGSRRGCALCQPVHLLL
jgi:hypothetical protein